MKNSEKIQLVKDVLGTELGKRLLKELQEEMARPLFDESEKVMYAKIGKFDFITVLKAYVEMSEDQLAEIRSSEIILEEDEDTDE